MSTLSMRCHPESRGGRCSALTGRMSCADHLNLISRSRGERVGAPRNGPDARYTGQKAEIDVVWLRRVRIAPPAERPPSESRSTPKAWISTRWRVGRLLVQVRSASKSNPWFAVPPHTARTSSRVRLVRARSRLVSMKTAVVGLNSPGG